MQGYAFASGELLSNPNTYFYTRFEGIKFFKDWEESRNRITTAYIASQPPVKGKTSLAVDVLQERLNGGDTVDGLCILDSLYEWIDNGTRTKKSGFNLINMLVKRFELTKRIYGSYSLNMRPVDKEDFNKLTLYVRAAEVFEAAYNFFGSIQYLNVLIKIIDTLCSVANKLSSTERERLSLLINKEKRHIYKLAESAGVVLW